MVALACRKAAGCQAGRSNFRSTVLPSSFCRPGSITSAWTVCIAPDGGLGAVDELGKGDGHQAELPVGGVERAADVDEAAQGLADLVADFRPDAKHARRIALPAAGLLAEPLPRHAAAGEKHHVVIRAAASASKRSSMAIVV